MACCCFSSSFYSEGSFLFEAPKNKTKSDISMMMIVGCVCVCVFSLYDAVLVVVFHKLVMCLRWIYIDVESFNGMVRKKKDKLCVCVVCIFPI